MPIFFAFWRPVVINLVVNTLQGGNRLAKYLVTDVDMWVTNCAHTLQVRSYGSCGVRTYPIIHENSLGTQVCIAEAGLTAHQIHAGARQLESRWRFIKVIKCAILPAPQFLLQNIKLSKLSCFVRLIVTS